MSFNGYIRYRRGILDHLHQGRLSFSEFAVYTILVMLADSRTGAVVTKASSLERLLSECEGAIKKQRIQDILASLHLKGYIRRFHIQGSHSGYPVLIHKYQITIGEKKDWFVDAHNTKDWRKPKLVKESEDVPDMWANPDPSEAEELLGPEEAHLFNEPLPQD